MRKKLREKMEYGKLKNGWPVHWPILTANDMCKGQYERGRRRCLAGWANLIFYGQVDPCESDRISMAMANVLAKAMSKLTNTTVLHQDDWGKINDRQSCAENAKLWNALGRELGYNVVVYVTDPEAP